MPRKFLPDHVKYPDEYGNIRLNLAKLQVKLDRCVWDANGCLIWNQARHPQGYGMFSIYNKNTKKRGMATVHRILLKVKTHSDLAGLDAVHTCGNERCVNIDHLFVGDHHDVFQGQRDRGTNRLFRPVGTRFDRPYNKKYRYEIQNILDLYHGVITAEQFAQKENISRNRTIKLASDLRSGRSYRWVKTYKLNNQAGDIEST